MRLRGEIALVTGSTAGIGRAIAVEFAAQGARVMVTGRDVDRGNAVVEAARKAAGRGEGDAAFAPADVTGEAACAGLVDAVAERFGDVTVLVNNAAGHDGVGRDPAGQPDRSDVAGARRDPTHARRRAWLDRQHLVPTG
jgi:NAD(P)-dependent dehydrogenase (short-subunit alcohol dehydrogenase family)